MIPIEGRWQPALGVHHPARRARGLAQPAARAAWRSTFQRSAVVVEEAFDDARKRLPERSTAERLVALESRVNELGVADVEAVDDMVEPWGPEIYARLCESRRAQSRGRSLAAGEHRGERGERRAARVPPRGDGPFVPRDQDLPRRDARSAHRGAVRGRTRTIPKTTARFGFRRARSKSACPVGRSAVGPWRSTRWATGR